MANKLVSFVRYHLSSLQDDATGLNERYAIKNGIKGFLVGTFRLIIIVGICYNILAPVLGIIANSFFSNADAYNPMVYLFPQDPTLERYETAITIMDYWHTMANSMFYTVALMCLQIFVCSMVGYGFARFNFPLKKLLFGCVVVMIVIPTHTIMLPLYMTFKQFDPFGLCTLILGKPISLMASTLPMYIMTALGCGLRSGLYIYIFNQFFRGLPKEIEEAALVDGCGTWYTYFCIMLRNAMPAVITVAVFAMVWQYNDTFFAKLFLIGQDQSIGMRISSLVANIANQFQIYDITLQNLYLDAGIVLMMVPIVLIYIFLQKHFIEGVERSGIVG